MAKKNADTVDQEIEGPPVFTNAQLLLLFSLVNGKRVKLAKKRDGYYKKNRETKEDEWVAPQIAYGMDHELDDLGVILDTFRDMGPGLFPEQVTIPEDSGDGELSD